MTRWISRRSSRLASQIITNIVFRRICGGSAPKATIRSQNFGFQPPPAVVRMISRKRFLFFISREGDRYFLSVPQDDRVPPGIAITASDGMSRMFIASLRSASEPTIRRSRDRAHLRFSSLLEGESSEKYWEIGSRRRAVDGIFFERSGSERKVYGLSKGSKDSSFSGLSRMRCRSNIFSKNSERESFSESSGEWYLGKSKYENLNLEVFHETPSRPLDLPIPIDLFPK